MLKLGRSVREALAGFVPASATIFAFVLAFLTVRKPSDIQWPMLAAAALLVAVIFSGYLLTACGLPRRRKQSDSRLSHVIAGGIATMTFGALSTVVHGGRASGAIVILFASGALVGLVQWARSFRRPSPPKPTLEQLEQAADEALARATALSLEGGDVIPIVRPDRSSASPTRQVA